MTFCHWKSNWRLQEALLGEDDLDLLIHPDDASRMLRIMRVFGFEEARSDARAVPGASHFFGRLSGIDRLVHVHLSTEVVTGDSLSKAWSLPIRDDLLRDPVALHGVPVPAPERELALFVFRMMAKQVSWIERRLMWRDRSLMLEEVEWLTSRARTVEAADVAARWFFDLDQELFNESVKALRMADQTSVRALSRAWLDRTRPLRRLGPVRSEAIRYRAAAVALVRRARGRRGRKVLARGGRVISVVGPDASGKSTVVADLASWLGAELHVRRVHLGHPPPTAGTLIPHAAWWLYRRLRGAGATVGAARTDQDQYRADARTGLLVMLRAVVLAAERKAAARRVQKARRRGAVVITDRYPGRTVGSHDGPRLAPRQAPSFRSILASLEASFYAEISEPDVVIRLTVDPRMAVARNRARARADAESDAEILARHRSWSPPVFKDAACFDLWTSESRVLTLSRARDYVWNGIVRARDVLVGRPGRPERSSNPLGSI